MVPFKAVCDLDLEGIIAKKLDDPYEPERTKWWKILNSSYSQKEGRGELARACAGGAEILVLTQRIKIERLKYW
jgi:ATP-dependent DNA ligase